MNYAVLTKILAVGWTLIMLIGCLMPGPDVPPSLSMNDKLVHVAIFVPFSLLWRLSGWSLRSTILAGLGFGILIEVLQGLFPGLHRSADVEDAVADFIGVLVGVALAWGIGRTLNLKL